MRANREVVDAPFYDFGAETQELLILAFHGPLAE